MDKEKLAEVYSKTHSSEPYYALHYAFVAGWDAREKEVNNLKMYIDKYRGLLDRYKNIITDNFDLE